VADDDEPDGKEQHLPDLVHDLAQRVAWRGAGASLAPSPHMPTVWPARCIAFKTLAIYCDENKHLFEMVRSRDAASHAGSWAAAKHAKSGTCPADDSAVVARLQCLAG